MPIVVSSSGKKRVTVTVTTPISTALNLPASDSVAVTVEPSGNRAFHGEGFPPTIEITGARPGDVYHDILTGNIYEWED